LTASLPKRRVKFRPFGCAADWHVQPPGLVQKMPQPDRASADCRCLSANHFSTAGIQQAVNHVFRGLVFRGMCGVTGGRSPGMAVVPSHGGSSDPEDAVNPCRGSRL
jgi:hypothetical protein